MAAEGCGGALEQRIRGIRERLVSVAAHLSAWADYPEEEIPEITLEDLSHTVEVCLEECDHLLYQFNAGRALREGVRAVIVGKPDVGKSTLMNLLAGCERSIVSQYARTTRDVVEDVIPNGGSPFSCRYDAGSETEDPLEQIGVDRARKKWMPQLVFAVFDSSEALEAEDFGVIKGLEIFLRLR